MTRAKSGSLSVVNARGKLRAFSPTAISAGTWRVTKICSRGR
jgi:hypothetical protein